MGGEAGDAWGNASGWRLFGYSGIWEVLVTSW